MKRLWIALSLAVLSVGMLSGCDAKVNEAQVTTAIAKAGNSLQNTTWHGVVEAEKSVSVSAAGTGKVTEIRAVEGQEVNVGDVLFLLDSSDLELQKKQAEASVHAAQVALTSAETTKSQNISVQPAQIASDNAKANFARIQELFNSGAVSQVDLDNAKAQMESTDAQLKAAINGQNTGYDSAAAQLASAQAALDIVNKKLQDCQVVSPIDGIISAVNIEIGDFVSSQAPSMTVIDHHGEKMKIQVADLDISGIQVGASLEVRLQSSGDTAEAVAAEISPVCDAKTGMFTVTLSVTPKESQTWIGLAADAKLAAQSEETVSVYVPAKCIYSEDGASYVYLADAKTAKKTPVTTGRKKNAYIEVTEGLTEGSEVVMQSSTDLSDGLTINVLTVK